MPGGHRTGAPGRFVIRGTSKYRLLDEKVRVFVGPSIEEITQSEVRIGPFTVLIPQRMTDSPASFLSSHIFWGQPSCGKQKTTTDDDHK